MEERRGGGGWAKISREEGRMDGGEGWARITREEGRMDEGEERRRRRRLGQDGKGGG